MGLYGLKNKRKVESFLTRQRNPSKARERLEYVYENISSVHGVKVSVEDDLMIIDRGIFQVLNLTDVVWVCKSVNTVKLYGVITASKQKSIRIHVNNGQYYGVLVATDNAADELFNYLYPKLLYTAFGYSPDLEKMWINRSANIYEQFRSIGIIQHSK